MGNALLKRLLSTVGEFHEKENSRTNAVAMD